MPPTHASNRTMHQVRQKYTMWSHMHLHWQFAKLLKANADYALRHSIQQPTTIPSSLTGAAACLCLSSFSCTVWPVALRIFNASLLPFPFSIWPSTCIRRAMEIHKNSPDVQEFTAQGWKKNIIYLSFAYFHQWSIWLGIMPGWLPQQ